MIVKSLELANFRKFRDPFRIDNFSDGFNIVVEPNETGKSTLLEALRAAFFIRYSAKTELVRSYVPIGDDVAPRVAVEFELNGEPWTIEKQFMKSHFVRLTGNGGRRESDAAEEALQELLGFERGNNKGNDAENRGPLGLLWVEQASALSVESPNRIVRNTIRSVLEAEVGSVTGGRRFDAIRSSIENAYAALRTPATGRSRGELAAAELKMATAREARQLAENNFREYEQALNDLDSAKARLKIVERDIIDPETLEDRRKLIEDQKTAETVALRLSAAEAEHGRADEIAKTAATRIERLDTAEKRVEVATIKLAKHQACVDDTKSATDAAGDNEKAQRSKVETARAEREKHEKALNLAREQVKAFSRAAGERRAIDRRNALSDMEAREQALVGEAGASIDNTELDGLLRLERGAVEARARFEAGTVKVVLDMASGVQLRIDGEANRSKTFDVLTTTRFEIGDAGSLVVHPPQGTGRSIEADLAAANDQLATSLRSLGLETAAAGIVRNERAAAAERELKTLRMQIAAACPADPTIALAAGADALRAFVATLGEVNNDIVAPSDDVSALEQLLSATKLAEAAVTGVHEDSRNALTKSEQQLATAMAEFAAASREVEAAGDALTKVVEDGDRAELEVKLSAAQRDRTSKFEALAKAREGAKAFDLASIRRRLENLDRAATRAGDERLELTARIASLEATVVREGTSGPAGRVAEAWEEEQVAISACERLTTEANTLSLLRDTLTEAANIASQTFLAPVTQRAGRYIQQLLPGCDLSFDDELGLTSVTRAGIDESCGDLSKGTQEQLAILTRLAFADLLLEDGAPISLILDDPLVYSDDARLETMTNILQEASKRMQVILLTCRSKAFRHVDAHRIVIA
jgi:AAA domain